MELYLIIFYKGNDSSRLEKRIGLERKTKEFVLVGDRVMFFEGRLKIKKRRNTDQL